MRLGIDGRKIPRAAEYGPLRSLDHAVELGMEGLFYRTVLDMSPTLDPGELREIKAHADELGLYVETGLGKVNPYATPEAPELRAIGDGDILLGFERMMRACRAIDCVELWIGTANFKPQYPGNFSYDRFRTDVTWEDQLAASEKFLKLLAPIARDLGIHLNMETHEEITTWEVIRLVESVGPDVMGITLDVGQTIHRGEVPALAAARVAPYVRQTHLKDVLLYLEEDGIGRQVRPCGQGVVDFDAILPLLARHRPAINLSIENPSLRGRGVIRVFEPLWQGAHPDLPLAEFAELVRLAHRGDRRIAAGEILDPAAYDALPYEYADEVVWIRSSAEHIRGVLQRHGL
ncbi:MAG: sugar phosphate isomerase/epimerase family protein [Chloroflexota bacterium]